MQEELQESAGIFGEMLNRNNKQIKQTRAKELLEDASEPYAQIINTKRKTLRRLTRNREASLDLSPDDTTTFMKVKDFDGESFATEDAKATVDIRNLTIEITELETRYMNLFGKEVPSGI